MKAVDRDGTVKQLVAFGCFTAVFLAIFGALYIWKRQNNLLIVLMLTPAVSAVLSRFLAREGSGTLYLKGNLKKNAGWYLAIWFLTPAAAFLGAGLYFLIWNGDFTPLSSAVAAECGFTEPRGYFLYLAKLIPLAALVNPLFGLVQCFGEELGWRGWLLPRLCRLMKPWKAVLLTGVIWGLWHAPIILTGFNYGTRHPLRGIAAMVLFCTVLGCIMGWLFFRNGSIWGCVIFHAALNGMDLYSPSQLFMGKEPDPFLGPDPTGITGGAVFLVLAVLALCSVIRSGDAAVKNL